MAVWAAFHKNFPLEDVSKRALTKGLFVSNGVHFNQNNINLNATRLVFASLNLAEMEQAVSILEKSI